MSTLRLGELSSLNQFDLPRCRQNGTAWRNASCGAGLLNLLSPPNCFSTFGASIHGATHFATERHHSSQVIRDVSARVRRCARRSSVRAPGSGSGVSHAQTRSRWESSWADTRIERTALPSAMARDDVCCRGDIVEPAVRALQIWDRVAFGSFQEDSDKPVPTAAPTSSLTHSQILKGAAVSVAFNSPADTAHSAAVALPRYCRCPESGSH